VPDVVSIVQGGKGALDLLPLYCDLRKVLVEHFRGCHHLRHFDILHLALFKKDVACFLQAKNNILATFVAQEKVSSKQEVADVKRQTRRCFKELEGRIAGLDFNLPKRERRSRPELWLFEDLSQMRSNWRTGCFIERPKTRQVRHLLKLPQDCIGANMRYREKRTRTTFHAVTLTARTHRRACLHWRMPHSNDKLWMSSLGLVCIGYSFVLHDVDE